MKPLSKVPKNKKSHLKIILGASFMVFLVVLLGLGLWVTRQTQNLGSEASACSGATNCSVRCNDGHVSSDGCPAYGAYGSCGQWAQDACGPHGGVREMLSDGGVGSGGGGADSGGNNGPYICPQSAATAVGCRGKAVNTVVPFGSNESCTCKRSGDACACRTSGGGTTNPSKAPEPIEQAEARCPGGQSSECPTNNFCNVNNICKPKRPYGANCVNNNQCASEFCRNGTCNCLLSNECPDSLKQYCSVQPDASSGICKSRSNRGENCDSSVSNSCLEPLTCSQRTGKCIKPPTR